MSTGDELVEVGEEPGPGQIVDSNRWALLAALYDPVWISAVHGASDFALAAFALLLLTWWRMPSWAVVILTAGLTFVLF